jgi:hypothetical protein
MSSPSRVPVPVALGLAGSLAVLFALGCAPGGTAGAPDKDRARLGKADGDVCAAYGLPAGCDPCAEYGWYGDGVCDDDLVAAGVCLGPDPDCEARCQATFVWLQKDAYRSSAGRTLPGWPPHTTTVLEVTCPAADGSDEVVSRTEMVNHGTSIAARDPEGTPILVEVKRSAPVTGTRGQLLRLVDEYHRCECDPATTFLSLDEIKRNDGLLQQILAALSDYVTANLVCEGAVTTPDLVAAIQRQELETVLAALPDCRFVNGASWDEGLSDAAGVVVARLGDTLAGYHVCNNDAMLQAELFASYGRTGVVAACDKASAVCHTPRWLYNP